MNLEFKTVQRTVNDLIPLDINPRKITEAKRMKMIESLQKFNLVDLPVIDSDNTVISGHQRLRALQAIGRGDEVIDVRIPNRKLTAKEVKEYNLLANTHFGEFDFEVLEADFMDVDFGGLGMDALKMDFDSFVLGDLENPEHKEADNTLTDTPPQYEAKEDDFETPEIEEIKTDIVLGDLIEFKHPDGRYHRLLCGDSTKVEDVERLMNGEKADMLTDPPYGININMNMGLRKGQKKKFEQKKWDKSVPDFFYLIEMFESVILWGGNYFADNLPISKDWLCWSKKIRNTDFAEFELAWSNVGKNARILEHHWSGEKKLHPTMKPVNVMAWCIGFLKEYVIFDAFLGSGSTMVASHQLHRNCYGMELDEKYCQVITDRMRKLDPDLIITKNGIEI